MHPRLRSRGAAVSNPSGDQQVVPWGGSVVAMQHRNYPTLQAILARPDSIPAGVRTQPVVDKHVRNDKIIAHRVHRPIKQEIPFGATPVANSRFQPVALWQAGYSDGVPAGDWRWPARFSGLWHRASVLQLPNPGDAQQLPAARWTRTIRVPRYSTLPPELTPVPSA